MNKKVTVDTVDIICAVLIVVTISASLVFVAQGWAGAIFAAEKQQPIDRLDPSIARQEAAIARLEALVEPLETKQTDYDVLVAKMKVRHAVAVLKLIEEDDRKGQAAHSADISMRRSLSKLKARIEALEDTGNLQRFLESVQQPDVNPDVNAPEEMIGQRIELQGVWSMGGVDQPGVNP